MEVLDPEIEQIDGCMYRINPIAGFNYGIDVSDAHYEEFDDQDGRCVFESGNDDCDDPTVKVIYEKEWYKILLHIPTCYIPQVCGKRGGTKQRLEKQTKSFLNFIPRPDADNVVIKSRFKSGAFSAYRRLLALMETVRSKEAATHFVAIPMSNNETRQKFQSFKQIVMDQFGLERGICEKLFQKPEKMHATIAVFNLADNFERQKAIDTLEECRQLFIDPYFKNKPPLCVSMKGVECMNDDPSEVNVLFGKIVTADDKLQNLADDVAGYFKEKNMACGIKRDRVKLHVTLMNTRFLKYSNDQIGTENRFNRITFDARNIIKHFENFDFGQVQVNSLCLCQTHSTGEDGFYSMSSTINFD